jgi:hypothetical protein
MSEATPPKTGGLWARLFGVGNETEEPVDELTAPPQEAPAVVAEPPQATAETPSNNGAAPAVEEAPPPPSEPPTFLPPLEKGGMAPALPQTCQACGTARQANAAFCHDCGWLFPPRGLRRR